MGNKFARHGVLLSVRAEAVPGSGDLSDEGIVGTNRCGVL